MAYKTWTKIDNGREGLWDLDVWLGVIQLVDKHEGSDVYDKTAPIYTELESLYPGKGWKKEDANAAGVKTFRPLFRDYAKPWTNTETISFEQQKFKLTALGRKLVSGEIGPSDVFFKLLTTWEEDGERPFQVLATAILHYANPLSFQDFYQGVMLGYRPGDDIFAVINQVRTNPPSASDTEERRLKLLLRIMELAGCIVKTGDRWIAWNKSLLQQVAASGSSATVTPSVGLEQLILTLKKDLNSAGLLTTNGIEGRFVSALLAKRFVILTGLAGSGKTKLAQAFAAWICSSPSQYKMVAVGADWTSNENLLGYADALQVGRYCKPSSGVLDLILSANSDPSHPYFLILDEMNLSHVERYFSDMLSAIESGENVALHGASCALEGVPSSISLPDNLFIIGTVNVDETTYMFSPKVLDRANVIEFRASSEQIGIFLDAPAKVKINELDGKGAHYGQSFVVHGSLSSPALSAIPATISSGIDLESLLKARLVEAFEALAEIGAEFGFRTANEISRFVYFHATLIGPGWKFEEALDAQVLQKLLPKLHGSERRLGPVLKKLEAFCDQHSLRASKEKIDRMADRLKDGFTSFAEA